MPNHRPPASLLIGLRRQSAPSAVEVTHFPSFNLEAIQTTTLLSPVTPSQTFKNFPVSSLRAKDSTPHSARHAHEVDCVTQSNERKNRRRSTTDHRSVGSSSPRSRMGSGSDSRSQEHEDESRSSLSSHFQGRCYGLFDKVYVFTFTKSPTGALDNPTKCFIYSSSLIFPSSI